MRAAGDSPGDCQMAVLHLHGGIDLVGVRAWVGLRHIIIQGPEELSWKSKSEKYQSPKDLPAR